MSGLELLPQSEGSAAGRAGDYDHRVYTLQDVRRVTKLEVAYAMSAGDERVTARRDEIALVAAIRANLVKYTSGSGQSRESIERDIRQLRSRAVMADGILDVFKSAGLDQPDLSILSNEFLAEVRETKEKNLAVETLRRLLADEIKTRFRSNIVEASNLSDRLDETLRRYNRAVDSVQVIEELIAVLDILPNPDIGDFAKEDGERISRSPVGVSRPSSGP